MTEAQQLAHEVKRLVAAIEQHQYRISQLEARVDALQVAAHALNDLQARTQNALRVLEPCRSPESYGFHLWKKDGDHLVCDCGAKKP